MAPAGEHDRTVTQTQVGVDGAAAALHAEVVERLADPALLGGGPVERFVTHAAVVLVGAREALKIKRPVRYAYLDFSTLAQREAACRREFEINRPNAPDIYLGVTAVTREADGTLALGGAGPPVEFAIRMRRFGQGDLLSSRLAVGPLDAALVRDLAAMVVSLHAAAPVAMRQDPAVALAKVVSDIVNAFATAIEPALTEAATHWGAWASSEIERLRPVLAARAVEGAVRRCHGDLHGGNIVLWHGRPQAFDAIEFDEAIATIDVLYDLAFLLMDLDTHGHRAEAASVLSRYIWQAVDTHALAGLAALPLFLSLRAGVRAMVHAQRAASIRETSRTDGDTAEVTRYMNAATAYLAPAPVRCVAVGGFSGSGKSTLAAALAPLVGRAPGAVHLRTDLERKALAGVGETERLPAASYTKEASERVYERLLERAAVILASGHSVVVDGVFSTRDERDGVALVAARHGAALDGVWLTAPVAVLADRVKARRGDASDATGDVVVAQAARGADSVEWAPVDAGGSPAETLAAACACLGLTR